MYLSRQSRLLKAALLMIACVVPYLAAPSATAADVTPQACGDAGYTYTTYDNVHGYSTTGVSSSQASGPFTISYTETDTASQTFGANASFSVSASAILASATATFGINYSYTTSSTKSWTYSTFIPAGTTGKVRVLHKADKVGFDRLQIKADCSTSTESGTATLPRSTTASGSFCLVRDLKPYQTGWRHQCQSD